MSDFIEQVLKEDYGFSEAEIAGYIKCRDKLQQESLQLDSISLSVRNTCEWTYSDWEYSYETQCHNSFFFDSGDIEENKFKFCPYCGKRIVEKGIKE